MELLALKQVSPFSRRISLNSIEVLVGPYLGRWMHHKWAEGRLEETIVLTMSTGQIMLFQTMNLQLGSPELTAFDGSPGTRILYDIMVTTRF